VEVVVSAAIAGRTVAELRDQEGVHALHLRKASGEAVFDPVGACLVEAGDRLTLQATLESYQGLRSKLIAA